MKRFKAIFHRDNGGIVVEPEEGYDIFGDLPKGFVTKWQIPSDKLFAKPKEEVKSEIRPPESPAAKPETTIVKPPVPPVVVPPAEKAAPAPAAPPEGKVEVKKETLNLMLGLLEYWGEMNVDEYYNVVSKQQQLDRTTFDKIVNWMVTQNKAVVGEGKIKPKAT